MMDFLIANGGTIAVGAVVAAVVILIVAKMIRDKKKGQSSCGCGCENCPSGGICHKK